MNASVLSLNKKHQDHKKIIENNGGVGYHDKICAEEKDNPGVTDGVYMEALRMGKANADDFMSKATNHNHPGHPEALSALNDTYRGDRSNVENDFKEKAIKAMGAKRNELRNPTYENKVFSSQKISNQDEQGFVNKFKDYMRTKWNAIGYKNDAAYIADFWDVHPMAKPAKAFEDVPFNEYKPLQHHHTPNSPIKPA